MARPGCLPSLYQPARWRSTSPADRETQDIGLSFELRSGEVLRLRIDRVSALYLGETLRTYLSTPTGRRESPGAPCPHRKG